MLLRNDDRGVLAIGQASHAWVSGQLARAWGNDRFGAVEPHEEVTLAAEQHDVGMAAWDLSPSFNPQTGLPHSFLEMPLEVHVELWSAAPSRLLSQCRYAALLVSMHGTRLYERRNLGELPQGHAELVRGYLAEQKRFQARLRATLRPAEQALADRNSQLIWTWDYLSLALCLDWAPCSVAGVPTAGVPTAGNAATEIKLTQTTLQPWPFATERLSVHCDGRRIDWRYDSEEAMRRGLDEAPWETVEFVLTDQ